LGRIPALRPGVGGVSMSAGFSVVNVLFRPGIGANWSPKVRKGLALEPFFCGGKDAGAVRCPIENVITVSLSPRRGLKRLGLDSLVVRVARVDFDPYIYPSIYLFLSFYLST